MMKPNKSAAMREFLAAFVVMAMFLGIAYAVVDPPGARGVIVAQLQKLGISL